jgi:hypothetical protein
MSTERACVWRSVSTRSSSASVLLGLSPHRAAAASARASVSLGGTPHWIGYLDAEQGTGAPAFEPGGPACEHEGRGEDRQADERDQQASARRDERGEEREPNDAEHEIQNEVERLGIGAALDQR